MVLLVPSAVRLRVALRWSIFFSQATLGEGYSGQSDLGSASALEMVNLHLEVETKVLLHLLVYAYNLQRSRGGLCFTSLYGKRC